MAELGLEGLKLIDTASRPDAGGSIGRRIMVQSNMFKVNSYSGKTKALRYHYDVTIKQVEEISAGQYRPIARQANDRDLPAKMQMRLLHDALTGALKRGEAGITAKHIEGAAFDGKKNIFTPVKFTFEEHTINMDVPGRGGSGPKRYFQISIREVGVADPNIIDLFCKRDRQTIQASSSSTVDGLALAIQSGEVALRHGPSMDENIKIFGASGRRFFRLNDAVPISDGAEILKGFFQSLRPTQSGLMLNLDVAYSCFLTSGPFLEVAAKVLNFGGHGGGGGGRGGRGFDRGRGGRGGRGGGFDRGRGGGYRGGPQYGGGGGATVITSMQPADCQVLRKALNGVMIKPMHRDGAKAEKFTGFTPQSASRSVFKVKDSTTNKEYDTTVVEYFRTKFNRQLRYPDLPCAVLKGKTFIPLEFCEVLGGTPIPLQRMKPAMTQDMIRQSALKPSARRDRNMQIRLENAYEGSGLLRQFDMNIVNDLTQTEARVLPSPTVIYGDNRKIQPRDGSWNLAGMKFIASGDPLQTIVLLNCARRSEQDCRQFASTQLAACQRVGMNVLRTSTIHYAVCQVDPSKVREAMSEAGRTAYYTGGKRKPPQLYVIFLDEQNLQFYETIKRVAALELATPVATQCVNVTKAMPRDERKQSQYCANVAMKINIKLGGTNQAVAALPKVGADCMLIGVDVTHPPPGMRIKLPSIIASVATIDGNRNRYNSELGAQYNKDERRKAQEAILDGAAIYTRHLSSWQERNSGRLPASIVVFRDGVSEGEYEHVVTFEVDTLKKVCLQMKPGYNPKVTFIVCGKRHHVRYYATDRRDVDRSENLPAGTVVDRTVVHPYTFDFYLQTQAGLVGTARPAHYQVIKDEIKFSSDELQTLLNNLTYTYARATRSVSLPPMVMYAHFLAEKGRALIYGADGTYSDVASTMSGDSGGGEPTAHADLTNIWQKLQRSPAQGDTAFGKTLWYM